MACAFSLWNTYLERLLSQNLLENGFENEYVCMKSYHKQHTSLSRYHSNLQKLSHRIQFGMVRKRHQNVDVRYADSSGDINIGRKIMENEEHEQTNVKRKRKWKIR